MNRVRCDDGASIAVETFGSGPRDVLLVHGWMVDGEVFADLVAALDHTGRRFIVPDLRGSGRSDKPDGEHSLARHARDLRAVLDALGSNKPILIGHSMGGQLAQLLTADAPDEVRALALLCPVPASGMSLPTDARALFRGCFGDRERQGAIFDLACRRLSPLARERLLGLTARCSRAAIERGFDAWTAGGFEARLSEIRAPTLVVATDDPFLPPTLLRAEVAHRISGARLAVLPGPGHYPSVESTAETAAILEAFLAGL